MHYDKFKSITENTVKWDLTGKSGKICCYQVKMAQNNSMILEHKGKNLLLHQFLQS